MKVSLESRLAPRACAARQCDSRFHNAYGLLADDLESYRQLLLSVETASTADQELAWLLRGLDAAAHHALPASGLRVYSVTPATLPLYSTFLFAVVPAIAGATVSCRPSSASRDLVRTFVDDVFLRSDIDIEVVNVDRQQSIMRAQAADIAVFTGSSRSADALADNLPAHTRLVFQGPGCCAAVVGPIADVDLAARRIVADRLFNNGQDCLAIERVYVHASQRTEFLAATLRAAETVTVGPNSDPDTDIGPLLHPAAYEAALDEARQDPDVRWWLDGDLIGRSLFRLGVCEAPPYSRVVTSESYGPLLPVVTYSTMSELREYLAVGDFALGVSVLGEPRFRPQSFDFAHVALETSLYDFEDPFSPFGGYRGTTFVSHGMSRRAGPVSLLDEVSGW
jgi:acyl-CoA reductase-like NAD-dependent aldehyde dehydrogenase